MNENRFPMIIVGFIIGAALIMTIISQRNPSDPQTRSKKIVVASVYPVYEFSRQVAGDLAEVSMTVPAGVEPHDFEPQPKDLKLIESSNVLVYVGGEIEPWISNAAIGYSGQLVEAGSVEGVDVQEDPHAWMDPVLAGKMVAKIATALQTADPANASAYQTRANAYIEQLNALHQRFVTGLAQCEQNTIVVSHDAFGYLGKRYNLEVESISGISPEAEPTPQSLARLSELVSSRKIKYVFFESLVDDKLARTLAAETGAQTAVLDPIEGITDESAADSYIGIQEINLQNLRLALACN